MSELDEDNNVGAVQLTVLGPNGAPPPPRVDWTIDASLSVTPARLRAGEAFTLTYRVANAGSQTASAVPDLRFYLTANQTVSTADLFLGGELGRAGSFAQGGGYSGTQVVGILSLAPGTYTLGAFVDPSQRTPESREDNNTRTVQFEVTP